MRLSIMRNSWLFVLACVLILTSSTLWAKGAPNDDKAVDADRGNVAESLESLCAELSNAMVRENLTGKKVAVMAFAENGALAKEKELGAVVQTELSSNLAQMNWSVVERERLADVLGEMELAQSGVLDDAKAAEVAALVGADVLILGSVSEAGDTFLINARAVSQEKGTVLATAQTSVQAAHLIALSSEAVVLRSRWDSTYRSLIAPGWGQFYNEEPIKGGVFIAAEVATLGAAVALLLIGRQTYDDYKSMTRPDDMSQETFQNKLDDKYNKANDLTVASYYVFGAAGGIWLINILDAAISGKTYTRTDKGVEVAGTHSQAIPLVLNDGRNSVFGAGLTMTY